MNRLVWLFWASVAVPATLPVVEISPVAETEPLETDVDDPAIWINRRRPSESLIVGTIKAAKPAGGLAVYSLNGKLLARVPDLDRPNNVDIIGDICVTTERLARQLRVYRVSGQAPYLTPLGAVPVFAGESGQQSEPMGIALWERLRDHALFAFVSRKAGPREGYLWQYRLTVESGRVGATMVRAFGNFSGEAEIEAVAVDRKSGLVYYSDENCCVHVWKADPDAPQAGSEVARFAELAFRANREGIGVAGRFVIVTDQMTPRSEYHVFRRSDRKPVAVWRGQAESTDGLDATSTPLGAQFPHGLLVVMNNARRNFQLYRLPGR